MPKANKFGTFSGVFTPSILTILGVIMYMRLGWVVGQAGLWATIGIVLVAHIISITTGLSISSIATDKKIKAGGIYYILSRSLGLPMGGAIGIALTTGTALSISMYIVGFAENFLSINQIADFLNLSPDINSIRIVGSIVLLVLVIIALISTSLAIKTQYFILAAIGVSLISIFAGFGIHTEFHPSAPILSIAQNGVSLEKVFAIFFPAVTGFTAGVAMSGDLKNPKKNIPIGTLLAIAVGFVVYMILSVGFAMFTNRDMLLNDNNIAMHVAWIPSLVVAGIWGATLSSALGGILGGPRILQALSQDNVTPKFFAKGYGASNEPRNALLMIFIVAEAGILIGDLNIIAGVVTMFYLTSYGFINLAYVLENWASSDFRPSFKVSSIYGIIGFLFAFLIMFKLDIVSMLVAFVIIGIIFFVLERKQLKLDYGDVWQSVWISVIRRALSRLNGQINDDRNWQPNIILFSGGTNKRPHLMEFGKSLVGNFGLLTNFDLIVDKNADVLFPKHKQGFIDKNFSEPGIFLRRQTVKDIYDGIEMIARTYGFSGIEPNTTILGWARNSKNPEKFVKLLQTLNSLDFNVILIDYDTRYGFGKHKQIDIWWRGAGNNGNFALTLAKLMVQSDDWENAQIKLMIVNDDDSKSYYLYRRANEVLNNMRITADVKIVNNEVEKRSFYDIVRQESKTADIVFVGIPYIAKGDEHNFVEKTNRLLFEIGTVVLVRASSLFKEMNLGVNLGQKAVLSSEQNVIKPQIIAEKLYKCRHEQLFTQISKHFDAIIEIYEKTIQAYIFKEADDFQIFLKSWDKIFSEIFGTFKNILPELNKNQRQKFVTKYQTYLINKLNMRADEFKKNNFDDLYELMETVINDYFSMQHNFFKAITQNVKVNFNRDELITLKSDSFALKKFKIEQIIKAKNQDKISIIFTAKERKRNLIFKFFEILYLDVEQIRIETLRFIYNFENFFVKILNQLDSLKNCDKNELLTNIDDTEKIFENEFKALEYLTEGITLRLRKHRKFLLTNVLNNFLKKSEKIDTFFELKNQKSKIKTEKIIIEKVNKEAHIFFESFDKYLNQIEIQNFLLLFKINSKMFLSYFADFIEQSIEASEDNNLKINDFIDEFSKLSDRLRKFSKNLPKHITIMDEDSLNDSFYKDFTEIKKIDIKLNHKISSIIDTKILKKISDTIINHSIINKEKALQITSLIKLIIRELDEINIYTLTD